MRRTQPLRPSRGLRQRLLRRLPLRLLRRLVLSHSSVTRRTAEELAVSLLA